MTDSEEVEDLVDDDYVPPWWRRRAPNIALLFLVAVGAGLATWGLESGGSAAASGPEGVPIQNVPDLAPASTAATGGPIDGITCRATMQQKVGYHIHVLVHIFVNGQQERLPAGAGIVAPRLHEHLATGLFVSNAYNSCLYWLHVHSNDGIIHIESPVKHTFTLGQFFDVWGQPLSADQVGPARGSVVAFENGRRYRDPRAIPLLSQAVVQLDIGTPAVLFQPATFRVSGLCSSSVNCSTRPTPTTR